MTPQSLYDILGVLDSASPEEIKAAHRRKIRTMHPDTGGSEEAAKQVNAAYEVLSDPTQRAEYDRSRQGHRLVCPLCDEYVATDHDLMAHIIRHRAEVATAQRVVHEREREAERARRERAEAQRTASRASASTAAASSTASQPHRTGGHRRPQPPDDGTNWSRILLAIGVVMVVAAMGVALTVIADNRSAMSEAADSWQTPEPTMPTSTNPPTSTIAPTTSTSVPPTTTTIARALLDEPVWDLADFDGSVLPEGTVSELPDEWYSLEWYTGTPRGPLTVDGTPGFLREFSGYFVEDWWLYGLAKDDQFAWTGGDSLGPNWGVLRYSLEPTESVGLCWSVEYEGPVVVVVESGSNQPVTRVVRAWTHTPLTWTWLGLDPALIDPSDVEPLGGGGDPFRDC